MPVFLAGAGFAVDDESLDVVAAALSALSALSAFAGLLDSVSVDAVVFFERLSFT